MWAISEMPLAKKRGSSAAPGMSLRNSGANSPNTVETCTPTFSNTRPFIIAITPPPPGGAGVVGAAPRCALEAAGRAIRKWRAGGEGVFEFFERRDDAVA